MTTYFGVQKLMNPGINIIVGSNDHCFTTLINDIMENCRKDYSTIHIFSSSHKSNADNAAAIEDGVLQVCFHNSLVKLSAILRKQWAQMRENSRKLAFALSDLPLTQRNNVLAKERLIFHGLCEKPLAIVFDRILEKKDFKSAEMRDISNSCRSLEICCFVTSGYLMDIPPMMRQNTVFAFFFNNQNSKCITDIYNAFAKEDLSASQFNGLFPKTTENSWLLVINCRRSTRPEEKYYFSYKVDVEKALLFEKYCKDEQELLNCCLKEKELIDAFAKD